MGVDSVAKSKAFSIYVHVTQRLLITKKLFFMGAWYPISCTFNLLFYSTFDPVSFLKPILCIIKCRSICIRPSFTLRLKNLRHYNSISTILVTLGSFVCYWLVNFQKWKKTTKIVNRKSSVKIFGFFLIAVRWGPFSFKR